MDGHERARGDRANGCRRQVMKGFTRRDRRIRGEAHAREPRFDRDRVRADDVRRQMHGARTTFVRVFEIHVDAAPASLPMRCQCRRVPDRRKPSSLDVAVSAVRAAAALAGGVPVTGFSLADLQSLRRRVVRARRAALQRRRSCGIAEIPVDRPDAGSNAIGRRATVVWCCRLTVQRQTCDRDCRRRACARTARRRRRVQGVRAASPHHVGLDTDDRVRRCQGCGDCEAARDRHRVHPGGLAAVRAEAGAGRADRGRR